MHFERLPTMIREAQLKSAEAFSPCSITGFFEIHNRNPDPLHVGSTGASVALSEGVTTRVILRKRPRQHVHATFNNHPLSDNSVSVFTARRYLELEGGTWNVEISHKSEFPVSRGYGTSGAGTLGLSFALNDALGLSLDRVEAAQIAHVSEIKCKTGMGTVSSVYSGGIILRTTPGAPGVAKVERVSVTKSDRLVTASIAPIATWRILGSAELRGRVNSCARNLVSRMRRSRSESSFMRCSRTFSQSLDIMSRNLKRLISRLDALGIESSMAMLGQTLFSIAPSDEAVWVADQIQKGGWKPFISEIATSGARLQ